MSIARRSSALLCPAPNLSPTQGTAAHSVKVILESSALAEEPFIGLNLLPHSLVTEPAPGQNGW